MSSTPTARSTRRLIGSLATALICLTATGALSGCLEAPHPKPLVVATPATATTTDSTPLTPAPLPAAATTPLASPTTGTQTPTPGPTSSSVPTTPAGVTRADVATAVEHAGIPGLRVITQPSPRARMGTDAILYSPTTSYRTTVRVRGVTVTLVATPVSYTWHFGDGGSRTTTTPGAAYPHQTVTHVYRAPGTVHPRVTTSYRVSYRVQGGRWRTLHEQYAVTGPAASLTVVPGS